MNNFSVTVGWDIDEAVAYIKEKYPKLSVYAVESKSMVRIGLTDVEYVFLF